MSGYSRRPIVIPKPPSFLEAFLYSTGIGMEKGADRYYKERDRKRGITQNILGSVLEDKISPERSMGGMDVTTNSAVPDLNNLLVAKMLAEMETTGNMEDGKWDNKRPFKNIQAEET